MKRTILSLAVLTACFAACRNLVLDPAHFTGNALRSDTSSAVITLERTLCYGFCPAYTLAIYADGGVIFNGFDYVKKLGIERGSITRDELHYLLDEARRIGFMEMQSEYESMQIIDTANGRHDTLMTTVTDLPTTIVGVRIDGRRKVIRDYYGAPELLHDFEYMIDSIAHTERWMERSSE